MEPTEDTNLKSLSSMKKAEKFKAIQDRKKENRGEERKRRREKYKEERQNGAPPKDVVRDEQLKRLVEAQGTSVKICVDLQYEMLMNEKELNHLSNQLKRVYSANKASTSPVHLYFTNLKKDGKIYETCCDKIDGFEQFVVESEEESVVQLFDVESLVYLSPDADDYLTDLDHSKVYVIGGLVDDSVQSKVSLNFTQRANIASYKLPIPIYMERSKEGSFKQILTINQIFEILLKYYETNDWRTALGVGVPKKTGFVIKPSDVEEDQDKHD